MKDAQDEKVFPPPNSNVSQHQPSEDSKQNILEPEHTKD